LQNIYNDIRIVRVKNLNTSVRRIELCIPLYVGRTWNAFTESATTVYITSFWQYTV